MIESSDDYTPDDHPETVTVAYPDGTVIEVDENNPHTCIDPAAAERRCLACEAQWISLPMVAGGAQDLRRHAERLVIAQAAATIVEVCRREYGPAAAYLTVGTSDQGGTNLVWGGEVWTRGRDELVLQPGFVEDKIDEDLIEALDQFDDRTQTIWEAAGVWRPEHDRRRYTFHPYLLDLDLLAELAAKEASQ